MADLKERVRLRSRGWEGTVSYVAPRPPASSEPLQIWVRWDRAPGELDGPYELDELERIEPFEACYGCPHGGACPDCIAHHRETMEATDA